MDDRSLQYNPLLQTVDFLRLDLIKPEHIIPALEYYINEAEKMINTVGQTEIISWETVIQPLDACLDRLTTAWGQVSHLHAVINSPELHEVYNLGLARISAFYTELGQNRQLYIQYKKLATSPSFAQLSQAQRSVIEHSLRDFRLSGVELEEAQQIRFKAIAERLSLLSTQFSQNVLEATDQFNLYIENADELKGLPEDILQAFAEAAQAEQRSGYKITLQMPSYFPVMQYVENRELREKLYHAFTTRASEFGSDEHDNGPVIEEILKLKKESATLLGFEHYAAESLFTKMAADVKEVEKFLQTLAERAKPYALKDRRELEVFAKAELGIDELQSWDLAYATAKLQEKKYAFSDQEVKQYFTEPKVIAGLFQLVEKLYGLTIRQTKAPVWHADVKFFQIYNERQECVGEFYMDLYARAQKRGGAWMADAKNRYRQANGQLQTPIAFLTCNFPAPVGNKPALFTHDDVLTLFHEFGHGLHHLLTQIEVLGVSGISGVEWDAVELPSQFMENFCWEWEVLPHLSQHVETGDPLPRTLFDKMLAAKNFQSGMGMVRQVEFSLFDLRIYSQPIFTIQELQTTLEKVRQEVAVNFPPAYNRFAHSFSHIFGGGYAAGYYSYKWAEVLSADAYAMFEEHGVINAEIGKKFHQEILSVGGSRPALESFMAFRGRAPTIDALLRHSGMSEDK